MVSLYTEEQEELITLMRDMTEHEIKPFIQGADEEGEYPRELFDWGFKMSLHMLETPAQYGGTGLGCETTAMISEELAKVDAGYAIIFVITFVALRSVIPAGTPEQARCFADIMNGGSFTDFVLAEPDAGSDPTGIRGMVAAGGDEYMLDAAKTFITNGALFDIYVGFFKTNSEVRHKGISAFITDRDTLGVSMGTHEDKMGLRLSNATDLTFKNVRVPKSRMPGPEGSGPKLALDALNLSQAFVITLAVGIMQRALDEAVKYVKERRQFSTPITKFQMVQALLADVTIRVEVSRCPMSSTMKLVDAGNLVQKEGSVTKTSVTGCAQRVTSNAVQVFERYGYSRRYLVEKLMRDVEVFQIFEGTNQIQRMTITDILNKEYK